MSLSSSASSLLVRLAKEREDYEPALRRSRAQAAALLAGARAVGQSFSGSTFGYHGKLYYKDFQQPPTHDQFSVEWGGLNGLSANWKQPTSDEVKKRIEVVSGVKPDTLPDEYRDALTAAKAFREEILIEMAPLRDAPKLANEKELLGEIESFDWAETALNRYCLSAKNSFPNMSRDSQAVMQGEVLPAHTYYEGVAKQGAAVPDAIENFWKKAERLLKQLQVRERASQGIAPEIGAVETVRLICHRFHAAALQLKNRRQNRQTLIIEDEYDVQDLLHTFLRLHFEDVRAEETTPSFGGGGVRMDFLMKKQEIVVEAKMIRTGLTDKEVSNELIQDIARYKHHPDCKTLICFVYDPQAKLKNPRGIENDLSTLSTADLKVEVIVVPKQ